MKKIATILGLFGLIFVQAQKVGINQDAPKATLDIKAETANTTEDVEGLLVPRVSKNKAFLMAGNTTTPLKESTLIYVDNTTDYTTTPAALSVADITEKGYYFWNGSKWAKTAGKDGAEWIYDPATKQTNLKRSGTAPFGNKVFYDESGRKFNLGIDTYPAYRSDTDTHITVNPILSDRAKNINMTALSKIGSVSNPIIAHAQSFSSLNRDLLLVDELPQGLTGASLRRAELYIPPSSTMTTMGELYGEMTSSGHHGNGTVKRIIGSFKSAGAGGNAKVSEYIVGGFNQTSVRANATVQNVYTNNNVHSSRRKSTVAIGNVILSRNIGYFMKESSETIKNIHGNYTMLRAMTGSSLKVDNVFGFRFSGFNTHVDNIIPEIKNYYGLYLNDVVGGTVTNYAIYTGKGKVRFGDLPTATATETTNVVVAGANGVLKTKPATALAGAEWIYDPATKQTNLKRSGIAPFGNQVIYGEKGNYMNYTTTATPISEVDYKNNGVVTHDVPSPSTIKNASYLRRATSDLEDDNREPTREHKIMSSNQLTVDAAMTKTGSVYVAQENLSTTSTNNTNNYTNITGSVGLAMHSGAGDVKYLVGQSSYAELRAGSSTGYVTGTRSGVQANNKSTANNLYGYASFTSITNANSIQNISDFHGYLSYSSTSATSVTNSYNLRLEQNLKVGSSPKITNAAGLYYQGFTGKGGATITNNYGILLENIDEGTNNYAIYTNKGEVRFGDDVGVGIAEATKPQAKLDVNGYIKLGSADATADAAPKPGMLRYDTTTNKFQGYVGGTTNAWVDLH